MRRVGDFRPPAPLAVDHRSPERHPPDHSGDDDARAATLLKVEHRQAGRMSGMDATSARLGRHRMMLSAYARAAASATNPCRGDQMLRYVTLRSLQPPSRLTTSKTRQPITGVA
jgi:hypothetical protein